MRTLGRNADGKMIYTRGTSDIPTLFRPGMRLHRLLVDAVASTTLDPNYYITEVEVHVDQPLVPAVMRITDPDNVFFAVHAGHHANRPGLSPFVDSADIGEVLHMTLEFSGNVLVRAINGDYVPPLPWMTSARDTTLGRNGCAAYWSAHAYQARASNFDRDTVTYDAPSWFNPRQFNIKE